MATQLFRPCIDLHEGEVKQLVGATLAASLSPSLREEPSEIQVNFATKNPPTAYAKIFRDHKLSGGHVIMLPSKEKSSLTREAAQTILRTAPGMFHIGGGIHLENARQWLDLGAKKVIISSALFKKSELSVGQFSFDALKALVKIVGRQKIVLDLSARPVTDTPDTPDKNDYAKHPTTASSLPSHAAASSGATPLSPPKPQQLQYQVMFQGWSRASDLFLTPQTLARLGTYTSELLIHAIEQEGTQSGIDENLIRHLYQHSPVPVVYAGGLHTLADIERIHRLGQGRIAFTVGSGLDLYGGPLALKDVIAHGITHSPSV